jgi:hypothetical protein
VGIARTDVISLSRSLKAVQNTNTIASFPSPCNFLSRRYHYWLRTTHYLQYMHLRVGESERTLSSLTPTFTHPHSFLYIIQYTFSIIWKMIVVKTLINTYLEKEMIEWKIWLVFLLVGLFHRTEGRRDSHLNE